MVCAHMYDWLCVRECVHVGGQLSYRCVIWPLPPPDCVCARVYAFVCVCMRVCVLMRVCTCVCSVTHTLFSSKTASKNMRYDSPDRLFGLDELLTTWAGRGLGCDGVFLDTLDTAAPNSYTDGTSPNMSKV